MHDTSADSWIAWSSLFHWCSVSPWIQVKTRETFSAILRYFLLIDVLHIFGHSNSFIMLVTIMKLLIRQCWGISIFFSWYKFVSGSCWFSFIVYGLYWWTHESLCLLSNTWNLTHGMRLLVVTHHYRRNWSYV